MPRSFLLVTLCLVSLLASPAPALAAPWNAPASGPRTYLTAKNQADFVRFCTTGEGAAKFARLKSEFDARWLTAVLPEEPRSYGKPFPENSTPPAVAAWRAAQKESAVITGVAESAVILWRVTGESRYRDIAKRALLSAGQWDLQGAAGLSYNDEAAFRLWRKLPFLYDQLRETLTEAERQTVLANLERWGDTFFTLVERDVKDSRRNSIAAPVRSHSVRFVAMVGVAGLALWDDLPEARRWFEFVRGWYADQFPPWGGDDGGWSEGIRYWETGVASEPVRFQDALKQLEHPDAWKNPFWRNTGYFAGYLLQPYPTTLFGDTSITGKVDLDWKNARFLRKMARTFDDGYLEAFSKSGAGQETYALGVENYPSGAELLISDFCDSASPAPAVKTLSTLPSARWFRDVGWVVMHSALGNPREDIQLTFVSSPYGSFSHSHASQNAFVLSAYGAELAVSAGYREFHGSPHHMGFTRQTSAKNAVLIGGQGQVDKSTEATGKILRLETGDRFTWTTGNATEAYNVGRSAADRRATEVLRDVVFVDQRFFIIRDSIRLPAPQPIQWLLHAETPIRWHGDRGDAIIENQGASLLVALRSLQGSLTGNVSNEYPVPPDADYAKRFKLAQQSHLTAQTDQSAQAHDVFALLWPDRGEPGAVQFALEKSNAGPRCVITRADGTVVKVTFAKDRVIVE